MTQRERILYVCWQLKDFVKQREITGRSAFLCSILHTHLDPLGDSPTVELLKKDIFNELFNPTSEKWVYYTQGQLEAMRRKAIAGEETIAVWASNDYESRYEFLDRMIEKYSSEEIITE